MNLLDLILAIPLLWGGYCGLKKGVIIEVFSLGAFFLAIGASVQFLDDLLPFFKKWVTINSKFFPLLIFILIFITLLVATICLGHLIKYLINLTILGSLDMFLGAVIGIAKWGMLISFAFLGVDYCGIKIPDVYKLESILYPIIAPIAPTLLAFIYAPGAYLYEQLKGVKNSITS